MIGFILFGINAGLLVANALVFSTEYGNLINLPIIVLCAVGAMIGIGIELERGN